MPEDIKLPTGETVPAYEWSKLTPDEQKRAMMPGVLKAPGGKGPATDFSSLASPEAGNFLQRMLTQNLPMAGVGGLAGGLTGGPVGALLGAGAMGAFPPENATQALEAGLGQVAGGLAGKAEKFMGAGMNPWAKATIRGSLGLGQEALVDDPLRSALGEEGQGNALSKTMATALPMLFGHAADRATGSPKGQVQQAKRSIQANVNDLMGKEYDVNATNAKLAASQGNAQAQDAFATTQKVMSVVPEAQQLQQEKAQTQGQLAKVANDNLNQLYATRDQILTAPQYSDKDSQLQRVAYLDKNQAERNKLMGLARAYLPENDPGKQAIDSLIKTKKQIQDQTWHPYLSDADRQLQVKNIDDQITQQVAKSFQVKLDSARKASEAAAQNLFDPKNPGTAKVQSAMDAALQEASSNPVENIYLKNLVAPPPNKPGTPPGTPSQPASVDSFISNLVNLDERHVDKLYEFLGRQKNGDALIQNTRDAMLNKFFAMAYDPQTKTLSNAQKLISGDGPFNDAKLQSIFGGGQDGRDGVTKFGQLVSDLAVLEKNQGMAKQSAFKPGLGHFGLYAGPTGLAYLASGHSPKVAATVAAATLAFKGYTPLVDAVVTNPAFAKAFHDWASKGGDMDALKYTPILASQFTDKNTK